MGRPNRESRCCSTRRTRGTNFPADFDAALSEFDLRDGEDSFVDELYRPATELGVALIAAQFPRTYLDPNRHAGDIDLDLIDGGHWPHALVPSGKAALGKALIWRTLDDGRAIYARRLGVAEVESRIARYHVPYHGALDALDRRHARALRRQLSHQLPFDERSRRRAGRRRARQPARRLRARRPRRQHLRAGLHRVRQTAGSRRPATT